MSQPPHDAGNDQEQQEDLISARLDGLLSDQQWAAACAQYGPQLEAAYQQAAKLLHWCRSDEMPPMPASVMSNLRQQLATESKPNDQAHNTSAPVAGPGSALWAWLAAGAVAAALVGLILPIALGMLEGPASTAGSGTSVAHQPMLSEPSVKGETASSPQVTAHETSAAPSAPQSVNEPQARAFIDQTSARRAQPSRDEADSDMALNASGLQFALDAEGPASDPSTGSAAKLRENASAVAAAPSVQPIRPSAPAVTAPTSPPAQQDGATMHSESVSDIEALIAEAEAFKRSRSADEANSGDGLNARASRQPSPLPEAVLRDALAAEDRAEAAQRGGGDRLRLTMTMAIAKEDPSQPAPGNEIDPSSAAERSPQQNPLIVISLANRGELTAPMTPGLLAIEGLNSEGEIIWNLPLETPDQSLEPGKQWDWAYQLSSEQLPPPAVEQTRLRYGPMRTEASPWPK